MKRVVATTAIALLALGLGYWLVRPPEVEDPAVPPLAIELQPLSKALPPPSEPLEGRCPWDGGHEDLSVRVTVPYDDAVDFVPRFDIEVDYDGASFEPLTVPMLTELGILISEHPGYSKFKLDQAKAFLVLDGQLTDLELAMEACPARALLEDHAELRVQVEHPGELTWVNLCGAHLAARDAAQWMLVTREECTVQAGRVDPVGEVVSTPERVALEANQALTHVIALPADEQGSIGLHVDHLGIIQDVKFGSCRPTDRPVELLGLELLAVDGQPPAPTRYLGEAGSTADILVTDGEDTWTVTMTRCRDLTTNLDDPEQLVLRGQMAMRQHELMTKAGSLAP